MTKRIQKFVLAVAALAALALGGSVIAQAQSSPNAAPERVGVDMDNVQSGDQATPDGSAALTKAHLVRHHVRHHTTRAAGAASERPGAESSETASESGPSDGPGGHADAPGSANADHQFQGNE